MQEHHLQVKRTARYFTLGELNESTQNVWFVLHGYGQLAQFFIRKFEVLNDGQTFIVAPEALSRFYLEGVSGRVGASWMTKEERPHEISDYIFYLNHLYDTLLEGRDVYKLTINFLGFSQGTATLIDPSKLTNVPTTLVYGLQDEYLVQLDAQKYEEPIRFAIPHLEVVTFGGRHTVDPTTLHQLVKG